MRLTQKEFDVLRAVSYTHLDVYKRQPREFSRNDISRLSGVSVLGARKFWHALGFPMGASNDRFFTEADLRALRRIALLVRGGVLDERTALALALSLIHI